MVVSIDIANGLCIDYVLSCEKSQQTIHMEEVILKSVKNVKLCYANSVLAGFLCNIYTA